MVVVFVSEPVKDTRTADLKKIVISPEKYVPLTSPVHIQPDQEIRNLFEKAIIKLDKQDDLGFKNDYNNDLGKNYQKSNVNYLKNNLNTLEDTDFITYLRRHIKPPKPEEQNDKFVYFSILFLIFIYLLNRFFNYLKNMFV